MNALLVCSKGIEILENFTYLDSVLHNYGRLGQEVVGWIGLAPGDMDSLKTSVW